MIQHSVGLRRGMDARSATLEYARLPQEPWIKRMVPLMMYAEGLTIILSRQYKKQIGTPQEPNAMQRIDEIHREQDELQRRYDELSRDHVRYPFLLPVVEATHDLDLTLDDWLKSRERELEAMGFSLDKLTFPVDVTDTRREARRREKYLAEHTING